MKTISWMAVVVTVALALLAVSRSAPSQPARDLAGVPDARAQWLSESTLAIRVPEVRRIRKLSNALDRQGLGDPTHAPLLDRPRVIE
jgi:hypothetical protein